MVLTLFCSVTAFAAESNLDCENRQADIGLYARYIDNTQWNTVPVDENGGGTTTLPDGTEITVSGALKPGWQLVIDPITEKNALDWIGDVLNGKAKNLSPLHIYFIDASGNIKTADSVTVTVKLPKKLTNPVAYSLTGEGKTSGLTVTAKDGSLTFTTDGSPFYVLGEKSVGGNAASSDQDHSPQTGENSHITFWLALFFVSGGALIGTAFASKRLKRRTY